MTKMHRSTIIALLIATVFIWGFIWSQNRTDVLTVTFLDVGQGDAIFIELPDGKQVLVDSGSGRQVLRALGEAMPFYDHSIDMIIATHPDKDHIGGFPDILKRFDVDAVVRSGNKAESNVYGAFNDLVAKEEAQELFLRAGSRIALGGGAYIEILFPDRDVRDVESNTASVIARIIYGDTSFLLTGDSPKSIEKYITGQFGANLKSNVLKAGHHGSKTSTDEYFLNAVDPEFVVISAGKDNSYGHPHKEVMNLLTEIEARVFATYELGNIIFESDGSSVVKK